jgi:hypothetical protein
MRTGEGDGERERGMRKSKQRILMKRERQRGIRKASPGV